LFAHLNHSPFTVRAQARNNSAGLRRIWVRLQGTSAGAYGWYVPVDVTPETRVKTSKVVELFLARALKLWRLSPFCKQHLTKNH
jgi:hypothetical protein